MNTTDWREYFQDDVIELRQKLHTLHEELSEVVSDIRQIEEAIWEIEHEESEETP